MSETQPEVSVIIPAYNREAFIGEAIDSVLAQEDVKTEIILVDGASSDETVCVARRHAPDIRIISEPDRGVADARNKGIAIARAPWIAFLDADDVWKPEKLRLQLAVARAEPEVALIFCDAWQYREEEIIIDSFLKTRHGYDALPKHPVAEDGYVFDTDMAVEIMKVNYVVTTSTAMVRTEAARAVGGFDPTLKVCEDYEFWLRVVKGHKAGVVERPLVGYRHHGNSLSDDRYAMAYGRIEVADRVAADPRPYPEGAETFFREERWRRQIQLGRMALHDGDLAKARRFLAESLAYRKTKENVALYLGALGGPVGARLALGIKRALGVKLS